MAGSAVDLAASISSSATSGLRSDNSYRYGDVIIGGPKPNPPWLWMVLGGLVLAGFAVWAVRR